MEEIWKDVKGYEGLYQVSNMGRVKRFDKNRIIKGGAYPNGYLFVVLCKNNNPKGHMVHRLVAQAFIPNLDNKPEIDHINTIKSDNRVSNLRWATRKENTLNPLTAKHRIEAHSWMKDRKGKNHIQSKEIIQLNLNGEVVREWESIGEAERHTGFNHANIVTCLKGKQKTSYGYLWKYKE